MQPSQPLVSMVLLTYNQAAFVREALAGALAQTYPSLEIIICDDASTDGTDEILREEVERYSGPHDVRLHRQPTNLGLAGNLNCGVALARGQLIVVAAGDDVSLPHRVETLYRVWAAADGTAMSIFSNAVAIDRDGKMLGRHAAPFPPERLTFDWFAGGLRGVVGCAHAWDRRVFDVFGPIPTDVVKEDNVIPLRAALLGSVRYVDEDLVLHRYHGSNIHFINPHALHGPSHLLSLYARHADGHVAIARSHLRDLDTYRHLYPHASVQICLQRHEAGLRRVLSDMELERQLFSASLGTRLWLIARAAITGTRPRRIARWLLWFVFTRWYYAYITRASHFRSSRRNGVRTRRGT